MSIYVNKKLKLKTKTRSKKEYFKHWCIFGSNRDGNNDHSKHRCNHNHRTFATSLCTVWKGQKKIKYHWVISATFLDRINEMSTYSQVQMSLQTPRQHSVQHTQHSKPAVLWVFAGAESGWSTCRFIFSLFPECGCVCIGSKSVVQVKWTKIWLFTLQFSLIFKIIKAKSLSILTMNFSINIYGAHFYYTQ